MPCDFFHTLFTRLMVFSLGQLRPIDSTESILQAAAAAAAAVRECSIKMSTMSLFTAADSSSDAVPESRSSTYSDVTLHPVTWRDHNTRTGIMYAHWGSDNGTVKWPCDHRYNSLLASEMSKWTTTLDYRWCTLPTAECLIWRTV